MAQPQTSELTSGASRKLVAGLAVPPPEGGLTLLRGDPSRREGVPPSPQVHGDPCSAATGGLAMGSPPELKLQAPALQGPPGCMRPRLSLPLSLCVVLPAGPPRWSSRPACLPVALALPC